MGFEFRAFRSDGSEEAGQIEGPDADAVAALLRAKGLLPYEIAPHGEISYIPWYAREIATFSGAPNDADLAKLAKTLAVLTSAGVTLSKAIDIADQLTGHQRLSQVLKLAAEQLSRGDKVADAFRDTDAVPPLFGLFVEVGEETNRLPETMENCAQLFQNRWDSRQKLATQLIYPAILVAASIGLVAFLSAFLAPNLLPMFASANVDPPVALLVLASLNSWPVLAAAATLLMLTTLLFIDLSDGKLRLSAARIAPRIPGLARHARELRFALFARSLAYTVKSGAPLHRALKSVAASFERYPETHHLEDASKSLASGGKAATAFASQDDVPQEFAELFRLGEEANRVGDMLDTAATMLEAKVASRSARYQQLATPALTLGIAIVIGGLVFSIMGAIMEMGDVAF